MKSLLLRLLASGVLTLLVSLSHALAQAPANDECSGATAVSSLPYHAEQDTRLATPNGADPALSCADGGGGNTVWYTYTADINRTVVFSTYFSQPDSYDVALALYTGSCGALTEVACNDDITEGVIRQAEFVFHVQAGVTYILQVAEWNGGGPSGGVPTGGDLVLDVFDSTAPPPQFVIPLAKGPKMGSVLSGAIVSTTSFGNVPLNVIPLGEIENEKDVPELPTPSDVMPPKAPSGSNYREDRPMNSLLPPSSKPAVLTNFGGNTMTGAFPPDPIMAVGPNHVVSCVNSSFQIRDKSGNLEKTIGMSAFFNDAAGGGVGFSDPQVIYDHFDGRWVIAGGDFSEPFNFLLAVSDDDDPNGTWYTWALPSGLGDSLTGYLPDYPQLGYDSLALYITSREFTPTPSFAYSRVRIVEKTQLYANTGGSVTWADLWDIREPDHNNVRVDGVRPSEVRGTLDVHFLVAASPYTNGTFISVWTIHDPVGTPSMTGANTPVVAFTTPSNAVEFGGGIALDGGGRAIRHRAIYRDSSLWVVHSVRSESLYSALHYVRVNPFTNTNLEDEAMGLTGYWHIYPALMVNDSGDIMISFTRSGVTSYPGAFLSGRKSTDAPGLSPSVPVKQGLANYQVIDDLNRNRWGDYMGIGLDPVDGFSFWSIGEYSVNSAAWGTWIAKSQMAPVAGKAIFTASTDIAFHEAEIFQIGDTLTFFITNNGLDSLMITSLTDPDSNFAIIDPPSLPISIGTFGLDSLKVRFNPKTTGNLSGSMIINSNDTYNPALPIYLSGLGYSIAAAQSGVVYGGTGIYDYGRLITIDPLTGTGTPIGQSGFEQLYCLKIHPLTGELWGLLQLGSSTKLLRINSVAGDAHEVMSIPYTTIEAMTFRGDTIYLGRVNGTILRVDLSTGDVTQIAATGLKLDGLDFNPITGELWASTQISSPVDRIFKIDLESGGTATLVGRTNFNVQTVDIAFDGAGNLFGIIGSGPYPSQLILIDTVTGAGTIVGDVGINPVQGLAIDPNVMLPVHAFRFASDWNLFSVPVSRPNYATTSLFPGALSKAFGFQGRYLEKDSVPPGYGFWLRFSSSNVTSVIGEPIDEDSVDINTSWNLIGSVSDAVPTSSIVSTPPGLVASAFYTYDSGGYVPLDSLLPGYGHWVKATGPGTLFLTSPGNIPQARPADLASVERREISSATSTSVRSLNTLRFRDAVGHLQQLYFGDEERSDLKPAMYELPPASPDGFDIRFASNRMVELHPSSLSHAMEFPLKVRSLGRKVSLSWTINGSGTVQYAIVATDRKTGGVTIYELRDQGDMEITLDPSKEFKLRAYETLVPEGFALMQNYPNPFNPTTTIRYELPSNGYVQLAVYDILGKKVTSLVEGYQEAGYYSAIFDAGKLASGIYFYRLTSGSFTSVQKMTVMK